MTKWRKHGLVIKPDPALWWMRTHAMVPTPFHLEGSLYRIYFAGRNDANQSHIGYAVIDMKEPYKVLECSNTPVLCPGELGTFDDSGVLPSCVIRVKDDIWLYYIGFKPGGTTRMDLFGGLAISTDNGNSFERWSRAPILERCRANPFINTAPWVIQEQERFRLYYVSGTGWVHKDLPRYNIQTALSLDGKIWEREGDVAIDFLPGENALARPYVTLQDGRYHMQFSAKGDFYLPYEATSQDGINWTRNPIPMNLTPTPGGPDAEMLCYIVTLSHNGRKIVYYNGNGYGANGICLATEEE